jgi:hypothetical protein
VVISSVPSVIAALTICREIMTDWHEKSYWHFTCMLSCESRKVITKKDNMYNHIKIELGGKDYDASNEK